MSKNYEKIEKTTSEVRLTFTNSLISVTPRIILNS